MSPLGIFSNAMNHRTLSQGVLGSTVFLQDLYYLLHTITMVTNLSLKHRDKRDNKVYEQHKAALRAANREIVELNMYATIFVCLRLIGIAFSYSLFITSLTTNKKTSLVASILSGCIILAVGIAQWQFIHHIDHKSKQYDDQLKELNNEPNDAITEPNPWLYSTYQFGSKLTHKIYSRLHRQPEQSTTQHEELETVSVVNSDGNDSGRPLLASREQKQPVNILDNGAGTEPTTTHLEDSETASIHAPTATITSLETEEETKLATPKIQRCPSQLFTPNKNSPSFAGRISSIVRTSTASPAPPSPSTPVTNTTETPDASISRPSSGLRIHIDSDEESDNGNSPVQPSDSFTTAQIIDRLLANLDLQQQVQTLTESIKTDETAYHSLKQELVLTAPRETDLSPEDRQDKLQQLRIAYRELLNKRITLTATKRRLYLLAKNASNKNYDLSTVGIETKLRNKLGNIQLFTSSLDDIITFGLDPITEQMTNNIATVLVTHNPSETEPYIHLGVFILTHTNDDINGLYFDPFYETTLVDMGIPNPRIDHLDIMPTLGYFSKDCIIKFICYIYSHLPITRDYPAEHQENILHHLNTIEIATISAQHKQTPVRKQQPIQLNEGTPEDPEIIILDTQTNNDKVLVDIEESYLPSLPSGIISTHSL
ncbi:MAG: hypothetical protein KAS93_02930 [Gammaproteobacteria bacterium]|nr:hypothetical protein [Gammaproteobacteria bacterium]